MDIGKALTYPQQDPNWLKKFVIAGLLYFVPIAGQLLVAGYALEITRRVIENDPQLLPEWGDWGALFKKGLNVFVVGLVYALPIILLALCSTVPSIVIGAMSSSDNGNAAALGSVAGIVSICLSFLILIYAIFLGVMLPAALGRVAATGQLSPAFRFGEVLALVRSKLATYFIVMLVSGLTLSVLSSVGTALCGIGVAFGAAYGLWISAYLHGQAYLAPAKAS
jgi:Protein of unknown function (DUF4013)